MIRKAFPNNLLKHLEVKEQLRNRCETSWFYAAKRINFVTSMCFYPKIKEIKYAWFKFLNDIIRMKSYVGLKHQTLMMPFLR